MRAALSVLDDLAPDVHLAVNVSPVTLCSPEFEEVLADVPPGRVVVELTEREHVDDVDEARAAIRRLGERGVAVASDDTGAGYAGLVPPPLGAGKPGVAGDRQGKLVSPSRLHADETTAA